MRTAGFFLALSVLTLLPARADEVKLGGGTRIEGVVLDRTEGGLRLLLPFGDEVRLLAADVVEVRADPDAPKPGQHLRYREPGPGGEGLEVAITTLVHPDGGPRVDLVAAVHIADASCFRAAQRLLEAADVVLYEGIKPAGMTAREFEEQSAKTDNPVRKLQAKMATWFSLTFQLDAIDYDRPHFVHADLTAEEFAEAFGMQPAKEGEGGVTMPGGLGTALRQIDALMPMLEAALGRPGPVRDSVKRMLAKVLGGPGFAGLLTAAMPELSEVLLAKRNAVVVAKVKERRDAEARSIAVFYGAAHMEGVEKALIEDLGYRRAGARWLRAWDIR